MIKESKSINPMTGEIKYNFDDVEKSERDEEREKKEEINYKEFIKKGKSMESRFMWCKCVILLMIEILV